MGTCTVSYVKESRGDLPHGSGSSNWCSGTIQRNGLGRKVGGGYRIRGHICTHG